MDRRDVDRASGARRRPGEVSAADREFLLSPLTGALVSTATGHRATLARCRCGLPVGGEGLDPMTDAEPPPEVRTVTLLGQVPGVLRWERGEDGLWHSPRTRYQHAGPPLPWSALGVCVDGRGHRVVAVG